jgi:hypothetical protein
LRKDTSTKDLGRSASRVWKPTNNRDMSLEKSFRQPIHDKDGERSHNNSFV